ncbi:MAG: hypothetical protein GWN08_00815, partial [Gemmatimonadetes bacterium]|nr:hypothetical protein [Gemmatimonadota bacterium]
MNRRYLPGVAVLALGFGVIIWSIVDAQPATDLGLAVGAATAPLGVLLLLSARLDRDPPWAVVVGGGVIGGLVAIASHSIVLGFAYAFFLGFADAASNLLDALRVDPRVSSVVGSPWTVVALIELVAVAPITEEIGKALGSRVR